MRALAILLALPLAGCFGIGDEPPPAQIVTVTREIRFEPPAECTSADRQWTNLPDQDVARSMLARNYRLNKESHRSVLGNRAICRASIESYEGKKPVPPNPKDKSS